MLDASGWTITDEYCSGFRCNAHNGPSFTTRQLWGNSLLSSMVTIGLLIRCSLESTGLIGGRSQRDKRRRG